MNYFYKTLNTHIKYYLFMTLLCCSCAMLGSIANIGKGSYRTTLPAGSDPSTKKPYTSLLGFPKVSNTFSNPIPTNDWASSLSWGMNVGGNTENFSANMFPQPLNLKTDENGLIIGYPKHYDLLTSSPYTKNPNTDISEYKYWFRSDLTAGLKNTTFQNTVLDSKSDWFATALWKNGNDELRATMGKGSPFVYFTKNSADDAAISFVSPDMDSYSFPVNSKVYEINGLNGNYTGNDTLWNLAVNGDQIGLSMKVKISYDFNGNGIYTRSEYTQINTDGDPISFEQLNPGAGIEKSLGEFENMVNGSIRVEMWKLTRIPVKAGIIELNTKESHLELPFNNLSRLYFNFTDNNRTFSATKREGNDFIGEQNGKSAKIYYNDNNVLGLKINGNYYGIFSPAGSTWQSDTSQEYVNNISSSLNGKNFFSIAVLPDGTEGTIREFTKYAYAFPVDSEISYSYKESNNKVTTDYNVTLELKESGHLKEAMMALYRHQWLNLSDKSKLDNADKYTGSRGTMKLIKGTSFQTVMTFPGILPSLPKLSAESGFDQIRLTEYLNQGYAQPGVSEDKNDGYFQGKELGRLTELAQIAQQLNDKEKVRVLIKKLKKELEDWFTVSGADDSKFLYYNNTFNTISAYPAGPFWSESILNDHHFHYGYWIKAIAFIAQYDKQWISSSNYGGMIELLINDVANLNDVKFTKLRYFDPYSGHSWSNGPSNADSSNNQESSSEAMNFATALILYGVNSDNREIRDLGIYLYTTELQAIEQYWMDIDQEVFPVGYPQSTVGMIWADGATYSLFFSGSAENVHGINFLPLTGGSLYLGRYPEYVQRNFDNIKSNEPDETGYNWPGLIQQYLAFTNPQLAASKFDVLSTGPRNLEEGESLAHQYHWIYNLKALGNIDKNITADISTYAVFDKAGIKTYVAYNADNNDRTVTFSDGIALNVPAGSLADSNGGIVPTLDLHQTDAETPTTPNNLRSTAQTSSTISLIWDSSSDNLGVAGYYVYMNGNLRQSIPNTSCIIDNLTSNTTYRFNVQAYDTSNNLSARTTEIQVSTVPSIDVVPPTIPTNLNGSSITKNSVILNWNASTDNVGVAGYEIYMGNIEIDRISGTNYSVAGLSPDTQYSFSIKAYDDANNISAECSPISVRTNDNIQPTPNYGVDATHAWFRDPIVTDFAIFFIGENGRNLGGIRMDKNGSEYTLSLDHGHIAANKGWNQYKFIYMTAGGQKETNWISRDNNPNPFDTEPPTTPAGLSSNNILDNSVMLNWNASSDNVAVAGYEVYRDGSKITNITETNYSVTGLSPDTQYSFSVKAYDAVPNISDLSTSVEITTEPTSQNNNPVANDDSNQVEIGGAVIIDVLANDIDPDGDTPIIGSIVQYPQNGTAVINANRIEYAHTGNNSGSDSFTYSIHDGNGGSAEATVILTITDSENNPNRFPVKVVNNTGRPDNQVYITFIGRFPEEEKRGTMARLNFDTEELVPIKMSDNDPQNDDKCTSYYRRLTDLTHVNGNTYSFKVPRIASARMYISVDKPVYFHVNEEPEGLAEPNVLAEGEIKSGYDTIYDIIEITWLYNQDMFVNTSNVDFLSIPFKIQMNMKDGSQIVRGYNTSRSEIFTLAENMGEPWSSCIVRNGNGEPIRFLGGTLGTVADIIPTDYLQPAIDSAWKYFETVPIDTTFGGWDIVNGLVNSNNELEVTASHNAYGLQSFTIAKPTSREGFASEGSLAKGSIIERKIQAFIGAAINRGVLQNTASWWNRNDYYKNSSGNYGLYNKYAELLHSVAIDERCYGFSYDDVNGLDSSIWMPNEKELIITIPSLSSAALTNRAPIAINDSAQVIAGSSVTVNVLANDSDPDGDSLSILNIGTAPTKGMASLINNTVLYTSAIGSVGTDSFTYTISDGINTAEASVNISIQDGNTDRKKPTVPTGLTDSSITANSVVLNWNASTDNVDIAGYEVYRDGSKITNVSDTNFTVTGLSPDTQYSFRVKAYDGAGNISLASTPISVRTDDNIKPTPNYGVDATHAWFRDPIVTDFAIFFIGENGRNLGGIRMDKNGSEYTLSLDHGHIAANKGWNQYKFIYMTAAGQQETEWIPYNSTPDPIDNEQPTVPTGLTDSSITANSVVLNWNASTDNVDIAGYEVYRDGSKITNVSDTNFTVTGLSPDTQYSFRIKAYDAAGNISLASTPISVRTDDNIKPTPNYGIDVTHAWFKDPAATDFAIFFIGKYGANLGGVGMDKINGEFSLALDHGHIIANEGWNQYKFVYMTDTGQKETEWISTRSNSDSINSESPTIPVGLTSTDITENSVTLAWTASSDNVAIVGYDIYKNSDKISDTTGVNYTVLGLSPGTHYNFTVTAYDTEGNVSDASNSLSVTTRQTPQQPNSEEPPPVEEWPSPPQQNWTQSSENAYDWLKSQSYSTPQGDLIVDSFENGSEYDKWGNEIKVCFTYDQATAVIAFLAKGDIERAESVLDTMQMLQNQQKDPQFAEPVSGTNHVGSWYNAYQLQLDTDKSPTALYGFEWKRHVGPVLWMTLAVMVYEKETDSTAYRQMAIDAIEWTKQFKFEIDAYSAFTGGWEYKKPESWCSTEHNIDVYAAFKYFGTVENNAEYLEIAARVKGFMDNKVFDSQTNRLYSGYNKETGSRTDHLALDVNPWSILAFGLSESGETRYGDLLEFVEKSGLYKHIINDIALYDFDWASKNDFWFEGSNFMALANFMAGNNSLYEDIMNGILHYQNDNGGIPYSLYGTWNNYWMMENSNSVSSTAWAIMTIHKLNPFTGERIEQPNEEWIPENNVTNIIAEYTPYIKNISTAVNNAVQFIKARHTDSSGFTGSSSWIIDSFSGTDIDQWGNEVQTVGYTYDQATAAIALIITDHLQDAEKILNNLVHYQGKYGAASGSFWTDYRYYPETNNSWGWMDWNERVGPNMWVAMAVMCYEKMTGTVNDEYRAMAQNVLNWALNTPGLFVNPDKSMDTAALMGGTKPAYEGGPNVLLSFISTEENLDAYAAFKYFGEVTGNTLFTESADKIRNYLTQKAWNGNRFYTGMNKNNETGGFELNMDRMMDVNPWGVLALGSDYADSLNFVDNSGLFKTTLYGVELYDFNGDHNDHWYEGSAFMSIAHDIAGNSDISNRILNDISRFQTEENNPDVFGGIVYSNSGTHNQYWKMAHRESIASTAWFIMAAEKFNPFTGSKLE